MCLSFQERQKTLCKESIKQEKQMIEQKGNQLYQPEEEKTYRNVCRKERDRAKV
jgi:hypothetical protein